jgi:hypothetical protein
MASAEEEVKSLLTMSLAEVRKEGPLSESDKAKVLEKIQNTGSVKAAAVLAGIPIPRVVAALRDLTFKASVVDALELYRANLEQYVISKAINGIVQTKYDADGNVVEKIVKDDSKLLLRMVERFIDSWKDQKASINVTVENNTNYNDASSGTLEKLARILDVDFSVEPDVKPGTPLPIISGHDILMSKNDLTTKERAEYAELSITEAKGSVEDIVALAKGELITPGFSPEDLDR